MQMIPLKKTDTYFRSQNSLGFMQLVSGPRVAVGRTRISKRQKDFHQV